MADVCEKHNVKLLTYGTLVRIQFFFYCCMVLTSRRPRTFPQCGGFLADQWLGVSEPDLYSGDLTPSQRKVSIGGCAQR